MNTANVFQLFELKQPWVSDLPPCFLFCFFFGPDVLSDIELIVAARREPKLSIWFTTTFYFTCSPITDVHINLAGEDVRGQFGGLHGSIKDMRLGDWTACSAGLMCSSYTCSSSCSLHTSYLHTHSICDARTTEHVLIMVKMWAGSLTPDGPVVILQIVALRQPLEQHPSCKMIRRLRIHRRIVQ